MALFCVATLWLIFWASMVRALIALIDDPVYLLMALVGTLGYISFVSWRIAQPDAKADIKRWLHRLVP